MTWCAGLTRIYRGENEQRRLEYSYTEIPLPKIRVDKQPYTRKEE